MLFTKFNKANSFFRGKGRLQLRAGTVEILPRPTERKTRRILLRHPQIFSGRKERQNEQHFRRRNLQRENFRPAGKNEDVGRKNPAEGI